MVNAPNSNTVLRSGAMIADVADDGIETVSSPLGHALVETARKDKRIVGLSADLAKYTDMHIFRDEMPDRFHQIGMAEMAMMGAAAGLAQEGFVPFVSTYSVFATRRAYDWLLLDIAEQNLNVNLVCALPGLTTGYGPSHMAFDDLAILRACPNLTILDPCDATDIEAATPAMVADEGPTYMRLLRGRVPKILHNYDGEFGLGKARRLRTGDNALVISSGLTTQRVLEATEELDKDGIEVEVLHLATIKPLDEAAVLEAIARSERPVFTAENHSVVGGLFESVAAAMAKSGQTKRITPISLPDAFPEAGALPTLEDKYGISSAQIAKTIRSSQS
ncbi:MAG: transketolase C-terminal domain-containing protein [Corynebacterium casei]|nr:transketolase C-terminal domain-containing protein [Corynebacterium casei]